MQQILLSLTVFLFMFSVKPIIYAENLPVLEPFTYSQNFETREHCAWASYPLWQDTAYDEKVRPNTFVPGDPNISIEQKVIPYSNVDNYAGLQKKLDMYLTPESTISMRYYLKTNFPVEYFKVRLASGPDGKIDYTISNPQANKWEKIKISYGDFAQQNPTIKGRAIKVNALAVLAKFPSADPKMPIYISIDDVVFNGARAMNFQFTEPQVYKLSEWKPYIPQKHYAKDGVFTLTGYWPLDADKVSVEITDFTNAKQTVFKKFLSKGKEKNQWTLQDVKLTFPEGLYLAALNAFDKKGNNLSDTQFTLYISPSVTPGKHPRLWFNGDEEKTVKTRLLSERFKSVRDDISKRAKDTREKNLVNEMIFDVDQFPDEEWINSLDGWFDRINAWRDGIYYNSLAYRLLDDKDAGKYAKDLMLKISSYPTWLHPWMEKRGRHIYYPIGELGMEAAVGFDLTYDLFTDDERKTVQASLMDKVVKGCHDGYVVDDLVTCNTSNWVAHITGGSLMCQAVLFGDRPEYETMEPFFTGVIMKDYNLIQNVLDRDGAYGEGYGYYNFSMLSWSKSLPAVEKVFKIDMSAKLNKSYNELLWAGVVKDKKNFYFGDSGGGLGELTNWAWLLPKYKEPLLGWAYNFLKEGETFMDVLYETKDVPQKDPFAENPVKVFKDVGTTVFKSGWNKDDFVFVMRTGPFVNHQHIDQGTFWLQDKGSLFIEERHNSTYYEDPIYQPWYIQPVTHSTILINGDKQSQRTGDPLVFAKGFEDYAYIGHFLDSPSAAFSSGNIGRLYWGNVRDMSRNVLYLKPDVLLMLDVITPGEKDVDVSLLYQAHYLKDIKTDNKTSSITVGNNTLFVNHVYPDNIQAKTEDMPHFLYTLLNDKKIEKEAYLSVNAKTAGKPLVIANILCASAGNKPEISAEKGDGFVKGSIKGMPFIFSTIPGKQYNAGDFKTDALALTWNKSGAFAAKCTSFEKSGFSLTANTPLTCEIADNKISYYHSVKDEVIFGLKAKPKRVYLNDYNYR